MVNHSVLDVLEKEKLMKNNQNQSFKLQVLKNRLTTKPGVFPMLHVGNDFCDMKIYYDGDYKTDFDNDSIDRSRLALVSKMKGTMFDIEINSLRITANYFFGLYSREDVDKVIEDLKKIKQTTIELQNIFKEYFKVEYEF